MWHGLATSSPLPTQSQQSDYILCLLMAEYPCSCRARLYFGPVTLWMLVSIQLFASRPALPMQICLINAGYLPWLCSKITDSLGEPFQCPAGYRKQEGTTEWQSRRGQHLNSAEFGYSGNPKDVYEKRKLWSFRRCDYTGSSQSLLISKMLCIKGQTEHKRMRK